MIKLYDYELSGNCFKVRLMLSILKIQYESINIEFYPSEEHKSDDFLKINPLGQLPVISDNGFILNLVPMNHPGGAFGNKIIINNKSICYFTDNEIDPPYAKSINEDELIGHCKDVDVLIHDAQYIEEDMPLKHGWGHSLISQVTNLGKLANVKNLVYYHHDPERSDEQLDLQLKSVQNIFKDGDSHVKPYFAYEGLRLTI